MRTRRRAGGVSIGAVVGKAARRTPNDPSSGSVVTTASALGGPLTGASNTSTVHPPTGPAPHPRTRPTGAARGSIVPAGPSRPQVERSTCSTTPDGLQASVVQGLPSATGRAVPTHCPAVLHASDVHALPSSQAVPGVAG